MSSSSFVRLAGFSAPAYLVVAASAWASRLVTIAVSLLSIRILLDTLGVELYAAYTVVMGAVGWFMLADFGAGQSLQNYISESRAAGKDYTRYIAATTVTIFIFVLLAVGVFGVASQSVSEGLLKQFKFLPSWEKNAVLISTVLLIMFSAWGAIIYRIWYAEQKGYLANIATTVAALLAFASIVVVSRTNTEPRLLACLVAANLPLAVVPMIALIVRMRSALGGLKEYKNSTQQVLRRASRFWIFNIVAACVFQIDLIVLSQFSPPDQIVAYSIGVKLFTVAGFLYSAILQAFWPVCAEALAEGNWSTMKQFKRRFLLWGSVGMIVFTICIVVFKSLIGLLFSSKGLINIDSIFILLMGILYLLRLWTDFFAVILQSMNDMKVLLLGAVVQALVGLGFQLALVPHFGINGTVIALSLSWILTVSWILPLRVSHVQKKTAEQLA